MNKLELLDAFLDYWFIVKSNSKTRKKVELQSFKYSLNRLFASFFSVTYTEDEILSTLENLGVNPVIKGAYISTDFKEIYPSDTPNATRTPFLKNRKNPYVDKSASFIFLPLTDYKDIWFISSNMPKHASNEKKEYQLSIRDKFILFQAFVMAKTQRKPFGSLLPDMEFWYFEIHNTIKVTGKKYKASSHAPKKSHTTQFFQTPEFKKA